MDRHGRATETGKKVLQEGSENYYRMANIMEDEVNMKPEKKST